MHGHTYIKCLFLLLLLLLLLLILLLFLLLLLLLLRKQGPRHTPQMHRSLEAYCATLGPPLITRSRFCNQVPPPHNYTT